MRIAMLAPCSCSSDGFECYGDGWWESSGQSCARWPSEKAERLGRRCCWIS